MPVALAAGHIHTGPFRLNLRAQYWVAIAASGTWKGDRPCLPDQVLHTNWKLLRNGEVVSEYRNASDEVPSFESKPGLYDLDIEVLTDASCLDASHPRLRVWTFEQEDYESYAASLQWLAAVCVVAGAGLLVLSGIGRSGERISAAARPNLTSHVGQDFQWARRLPRRRPVSRLPGFGLYAGIFFGLLAIVMMVLLPVPVIPRVLWVHLLKAAKGPTKSDAWTEPLIVRVKDAGPGKRPDVYVNSKPLAWEDLDRVLKEELGRRKEWVVYVAGDDDTAFQNVADVIDVARGEQAKVYLLPAGTKSPP